MEYTIEQIAQMEALGNVPSFFNENEVKRDPHTGRIIDGPDGPDDKLQVTFSTEATFSKLKTWEAGGVPKYVDMDFISIYAPGMNKYFTIHRPVTDHDIFRFGKEYAQFKTGQGEMITGTPLALWPVMTPSQIKELEYRGIRTVEQMAGLSDSITSIAGLQQLKIQAKEFLELAKELANQGAMQAKINELSKERDAEVAALKAQVEQLIAGQQGSKAPRKTL
jgi:hypothetical protein